MFTQIVLNKIQIYFILVKFDANIIRMPLIPVKLGINIVLIHMLIPDVDVEVKGFNHTNLIPDIHVIDSLNYFK